MAAFPTAALAQPGVDPLRAEALEKLGPVTGPPLGFRSFLRSEESQVESEPSIGETPPIEFDRRPAPSPAPATTASDHVEAVQKALNQLGYDTGPVDGTMGPKTRDAILAYQKAHGLPQSGVASSSFAARLMADLNRRAQEKMPVARVAARPPEHPQDTPRAKVRSCLDTTPPEAVASRPAPQPASASRVSVGPSKITILIDEVAAPGDEVHRTRPKTTVAELTEPGNDSVIPSLRSVAHELWCVAQQVYAGIVRAEGFRRTGCLPGPTGAP